MPQQSLAEFIGEIVAATTTGAISSEAVEQAKVSILHNLAVGLAGRRIEPVAAAMAAAYYAVPAEASVIRSGRRASVEGAAFANAALFHARSQDDTHPDSTSHPGGPVMAAALAVGEAQGASGAEFIAAVVLGYEALCRIGRDFDQEITGRGFRAAAVLGGFGAAAAAARLMRLSPAQSAHALAIAGNMAGGLAQVWLEGSAEYPLQLGFAARNGIVAARAAACGATAARFALDGRKGFFNAYAGTTAEPVEARSPLHGSGWQIQQATVKPFPACAILQGPLDLLIDMLGDGASAPVVAVALALNPYEAAYPGVDNPGPCATPAAAKMSAQFCLGNALVRRRLAFADLEACDDPLTADHARRIAVLADASVAERHCRITVDWQDGRSSTRTLERPVGRPLFADVARFAAGLAEEMELTEAAVARIVDVVANLEREPDLARLVSGLMAAGRPDRLADRDAPAGLSAPV